MKKGGPKRPEYEPKTLHDKLAYLVEECGETQAAVGKALRWGLESTNPELPKDAQETNRAWILRELLDLEAAVARVRGELENNVDDGGPRRCLYCGRPHNVSAAVAEENPFCTACLQERRCEAEREATLKVHPLKRRFVFDHVGELDDSDTDGT